MRSVLIIIFIYIGLFFYGENIAVKAPEREEVNEKVILKNNRLPLYRGNGSKVSDFSCEILETDYTEFIATKIKAHIYPKQESETKSKDFIETQNIKLPPEDILLDADKAYFSRTKTPIALEGNIKMTFGQTVFLAANICKWDRESDLLHFPDQFSIQKGNHFISGKNVTFNSKDKDIKIEKDIVAFFEMTENKETNQNNSKNGILSKLTSKGPLLYKNSFKSIKLPNKSEIKNQKYTLQANAIEIILDENNKIEILNAEGDVKIHLLEKNIFASSPKATLDFKERNFNFMSTTEITPYIDTNGFRQSASYITYNENTGIMKAGPEVKSVKIPGDANE